MQARGHPVERKNYIDALHSLRVDNRQYNRISNEISYNQRIERREREERAGGYSAPYCTRNERDNVRFNPYSRSTQNERIEQHYYYGTEHSRPMQNYLPKYEKRKNDFNREKGRYTIDRRINPRENFVSGIYKETSIRTKSNEHQNYFANVYSRNLEEEASRNNFYREEDERLTNRRKF